MRQYLLLSFKVKTASPLILCCRLDYAKIDVQKSRCPEAIKVTLTNNLWMGSDFLDELTVYVLNKGIKCGETNS